MSVTVLPKLLSLDLTAGLVKQGQRAPWKQVSQSMLPQAIRLIAEPVRSYRTLLGRGAAPVSAK